jgi:uncharacterized integral membrane protein (TIGR00698 family)
MRTLHATGRTSHRPRSEQEPLPMSTTTARLRRLRTTVPGLAIALGVALVATGLARFLPPTIGPVLLAVLLGLVIGNVTTLPAITGPGLSVASKRILRIGVVLLGARLTFADVAEIGGPAVGVVVLTMTAAFLSVALASRLAGIPPRLATLIGVGTAVCGNSAIVATSPIIEAEDREISFAVATITIFGTAALLLFPVIALLVDLPDRVFGFWAGLSINDTSQVVAAGAAYSDEALEVATVVKLVRNAFMAPLILLIAWWSARQRVVTGEADVRGSALKAFPLFLLGFLALAALRSLGALSDEAAARFGTAATLCITVAIAAVGCSTRIDQLRQVGLRPFLVGFGAAVTLAVVGLAFATWLGS